MDMSLLWAVPPIAVAVAAVIAMMQLSTMAQTAADLGTQLRRLDEVRMAVATVRAESESVRATARNLRPR